MMKKLLFLVLAVSLAFAACTTPSTTTPPSPSNPIREAVERMLAAHPQSTLQDIYKSCFQDMFGPGHLINDSTAARQYLQHELSETDYIDTVLVEPTGIHGNYVRVNLQMVKSEVITEETLLEALISSANSATPPSIEEWKQQWLQIVEEIRLMNIQLPHFEEDCTMLEQMLSEGKYVMHHSDIFDKAYHPHYRIIEKGIFSTLDIKAADGESGEYPNPTKQSAFPPI